MTKTIDLTITHDYLNPFASPDNPKLSPELVDYLSDSAGTTTSCACTFAVQKRSVNACSRPSVIPLRKRGNNSEGYSHPTPGSVDAPGLALALVLAGTALGIEGTIPVGVVTVTAWMLLWRSAEIFF